MKTALGVICTVVLLSACTAGTVTSQKTESYQGTIARLAIVVRDPGREGSQVNPRLRGAPDVAMVRAVTDLRQTLPVRLPAVFSGSVPTVVVQGPLDKTARPAPAGTTHALVVEIGGGASTCNLGSCAAQVDIEARLLDVRSRAVAWTGQLSVAEPADRSRGTMADAVAEQLLAALRKDGLIR